MVYSLESQYLQTIDDGNQCQLHQPNTSNVSKSNFPIQRLGIAISELWAGFESI